MWSSETKTGNLNRRAVLAGLGALSLAAACGFTPVYAPGGGGSRLLNAVSLQAPDDDRRYVFNRRFEERLGRPASGAPYALTVRIQVTEQDIGVTSTGNITRYRLIGRVFYTLTDATTGAILHDGRTNAFTGYSTTGSTVATSAAERDAEERLMVILADQMIDDLLLRAADFPDPASPA
ncbi:LPS assembly lipoprotein LptE [Sagittula sp. MA-2]|jgi:LPS-assembly lipoprotein|uniref:LPS assembly lipoprotein LptE n=1 Tax=Sagittula sp. MA-2 TaxID=3048007 RepID=UPI0024C3D99E|nr:LPS assembly lipoprotein LptE [Sagittula sp. MA-2]WHZ34577.1 LPS assembly lipoprotein LptE [Sagittula sp. MA-2]